MNTVANGWPPLTRKLLEDLARRYYKPLLSFFRKRTHNAPEVGDLVQQVFLRLAQYPGLEHMHNPDGYIFQTAANTLRDYYRHQAVCERHLRLVSDGEVERDSEFSPERVLQDAGPLPLLSAASISFAATLYSLKRSTRKSIKDRTFIGRNLRLG